MIINTLCDSSLLRDRFVPEDWIQSGYFTIFYDVHDLKLSNDALASLLHYAQHYAHVVRLNATPALALVDVLNETRQLWTGKEREVAEAVIYLLLAMNPTHPHCFAYCKKLFRQQAEGNGVLAKIIEWTEEHPEAAGHPDYYRLAENYLELYAELLEGDGYLTGAAWLERAEDLFLGFSPAHLKTFLGMFPLMRRHEIVNRLSECLSAHPQMYARHPVFMELLEELRKDYQENPASIRWISDSRFVFSIPALYRNPGIASLLKQLRASQDVVAYISQDYLANDYALKNLVDLFVKLESRMNRKGVKQDKRQSWHYPRQALIDAGILNAKCPNMAFGRIVHAIVPKRTVRSVENSCNHYDSMHHDAAAESVRMEEMQDIICGIDLL